MSEEFLYDDFFFGEDDLVPLVLQVRGKSLPFKVKRGVNAADLASAKRVTMKFSLDKDGNPVMGNPDPVAFENELLVRVVKEWPFKNSDGTPVPITRANMDLLSGDVTQALSQKIMALVQRGQEALVPFEKPSEEVS